MGQYLQFLILVWSAWYRLPRWSSFGLITSGLALGTEEEVKKEIGQIPALSENYQEK